MAQMTLNIGSKQANDLAIICAHGSARLEAFINKLDSFTHPTIRLTKLRHEANEIFGKDDAGVLFRHIIGLNSLKRQTENSLGEILEAITVSLKASDWTEQEHNLWSECLPIIEKLLISNVFGVARKALDLSMSHENMLTDSSIITDIRPVFNDSRSGILGSIITFTMMLELSSQDSDKRVSIAMDLKDVEELKRSCEMAIEKGKEAQSVMQDKCGFDTFIMGEEDYGL